MNQGRKEFILGILLTFLLWLFSPEIIPENIVPYIKPAAVAIIILSGIWVLIGDKIINWYNSTSNERKQKKILSLQSEIIRIQAFSLLFQNNPDKFIKSVTADILKILYDLCLGFILINVSSLFDFFKPIPIGIIAIPSFWDAFKGAGKALRFYRRILFFSEFKEESEANIRKLSSPNQQTNLRIIKAFYKVNNTDLKYDVTNILNNKVADNKIDCVVNDDLLSFDPAPGLQKELSLKYSLNRASKEITIAIGERLTLP